jgi:hypothetical protein
MVFPATFQKGPQPSLPQGLAEPPASRTVLAVGLPPECPVEMLLAVLAGQRVEPVREALHFLMGSGLTPQRPASPPTGNSPCWPDF